MVSESMSPSAYLGHPLLYGELWKSSTQGAAAGDGCAGVWACVGGSPSFSAYEGVLHWFLQPRNSARSQWIRWMHLVRARPWLKELTVDLKIRDRGWEKGCIAPKINNVDLMCRENKQLVRGGLSHLETERISTQHQFSALIRWLLFLKAKCCSSGSLRSLRLSRLFRCLGPSETNVHLVRLSWRLRQLLGLVKTGALHFAVHVGYKADLLHPSCLHRHFKTCMKVYNRGTLFYVPI